MRAVASEIGGVKQRRGSALGCVDFCKEFSSIRHAGARCGLKRRGRSDRKVSELSARSGCCYPHYIDESRRIGCDAIAELGDARLSAAKIRRIEQESAAAERWIDFKTKLVPFMLPAFRPRLQGIRGCGEIGGVRLACYENVASGIESDSKPEVASRTPYIRGVELLRPRRVHFRDKNDTICVGG